jgi:hypothetical protein
MLARGVHDREEKRSGKRSELTQVPSLSESMVDSSTGCWGDMARKSRETGGTDGLKRQKQHSDEKHPSMRSTLQDGSACPHQNCSLISICVPFPTSRCSYMNTIQQHVVVRCYVLIVHEIFLWQITKLFLTSHVG